MSALQPFIIEKTESQPGTCYEYSLNIFFSLHARIIRYDKIYFSADGHMYSFNIPYELVSRINPHLLLFT